ncbi:MAG: transposase [Spirochaetes bacterium]|nr:transposase [Spirochaetota bacterium]
MSGRLLRFIAENTSYHIFARFNNYEEFLKDITYKEEMFKIIKQAQKKHNFLLNAYEILDDHFHFIIKVLEGTTISKIMHWINTKFAKRINKLLGRRGHVFNERFGSKVIDHAKNPIKYFLSLLWYMAYNSVRKGYVDNPRDYPYNSIKYYLQENYIGKVKITLHEFFTNLSDKFLERLEVLLQIEKDYRKILVNSY